MTTNENAHYTAAMGGSDANAHLRQKNMHLRDDENESMDGGESDDSSQPKRHREESLSVGMSQASIDRAALKDIHSNQYGQSAFNDGHDDGADGRSEFGLHTPTPGRFPAPPAPLNAWKQGRADKNGFVSMAKGTTQASTVKVTRVEQVIFPIGGKRGIAHDPLRMPESTQVLSSPPPKTLRMKANNKIDDALDVFTELINSAVSNDCEEKKGSSHFFNEENDEVEFPTVTEEKQGPDTVYDVRFDEYVQAAYFKQEMAPLTVPSTNPKAPVTKLEVIRCGEIYERGTIMVTLSPAVEMGDDPNEVLAAAYENAIKHFLLAHPHLHGLSAYRPTTVWSTGRMKALPLVHLLLKHRPEFHSESLPGFINDKGVVHLNAKDPLFPLNAEWFKLSFGFRSAWCRNCKTEIHPYETCKHTECNNCHQGGHLSNSCPINSGKRRFNNRR